MVLHSKNQNQLWEKVRILCKSQSILVRYVEVQMYTLNECKMHCLIENDCTKAVTVSCKESRKRSARTLFTDNKKIDVESCAIFENCKPQRRILYATLLL